MTAKQERILVVDDEAVVRKLLCRRLSMEGYLCREACNADDALVKLKNGPVELALLDVRMPGKSGTELLAELRASYPDTAVIMATAVADTDIAIQCMKNGAYDYLTKPFNLEGVALSVGRALEKRRLELANRDYEQNLEQKVKKQARKISASFFNAITSLAYALEAKDEYTSGHSRRVAETAVSIAKELGMPLDSVEKIRLAGLIHDIGKIGVRENVLNKPAKLTDEEFCQVKRHCEMGEYILKPIVDAEDILKMVRHHHEQYAGSGYPDALSGDGILLGARILAVADAYDAMISERPYREAMSIEVACAEIERCKGTQFDPEVVKAFHKMKKGESSTDKC